MSKHTLADYLALTDSNIWIIQDLLPVGGKLNIMGESKIGKSFMGIQLAEALSPAPNPAWLGHFPVLIKGPVYYMQIDTSRGVWQDRLRKLHDPLDLSGIDYSDKEDLPRHFDVTLPCDRRYLTHLVQEREHPQVVILDVIRCFHRGSEDESGHMQDVLDSIEEAIYPAAMVILSHTRKPPSDKKAAAENEGSMHENRGSNMLNGSVDTLAKLTENYLYFEPRSAEKFRLPIQRTANGLWRVRAEPTVDGTTTVAEAILSVEAQAKALVGQMPNLTLGARQLCNQFPTLSMDEAKKMLRRVAG